MWHLACRTTVPIDEAVGTNLRRWKGESDFRSGNLHDCTEDGTVTSLQTNSLLETQTPAHSETGGQGTIPGTATYQSRVYESQLAQHKTEVSGSAQEGSGTFTPGQRLVPFPADLLIPLFDTGTGRKKYQMLVSLKWTQ